LLITRDLDEVADESCETLDLADQIAEQLLALDRVDGLSALEELEVRPQAGERSPKLVRRVGNQLTLRAQRGLELSEHGVAACPEAAQLISPLGGDTPREVAGPCHLLDGRREPLHRCDGGAANDRAECCRQENRPCRE